jgi:hypothetical protein
MDAKRGGFGIRPLHVFSFSLRYYLFPYACSLLPPATMKAAILAALQSASHIKKGGH